jgi:hypothetical protein
VVVVAKEEDVAVVAVAAEVVGQRVAVAVAAEVVEQRVAVAVAHAA